MLMLGGGVRTDTEKSNWVVELQQKALINSGQTIKKDEREGNYTKQWTRAGIRNLDS